MFRGTSTSSTLSLSWVEHTVHMYSTSSGTFLLSGILGRTAFVTFVVVRVWLAPSISTTYKHKAINDCERLQIIIKIIIFVPQSPELDQKSKAFIVVYHVTHQQMQN